MTGPAAPFKPAIKRRLGVIGPSRRAGQCLRRLGDLRPVLSAAPVARETTAPELVCLRHAPAVILRHSETHRSWHLSPRLEVALSLSIAAPKSTGEPGRADRREAASVGVPANGVGALQSRVETIVTRQVQLFVETLVSRRERRFAPEAVSAAMSVPVAIRATVATDQTALMGASPELIVRHAPRPSAEVKEAVAAPDAGAGPRPFHRAPPSSQPDPRFPDLEIARIADHVVRALDHRAIAWRERFGSR
jgi:hypothetical protein